MRLETIERTLYPVEREVNPVNRKQHFLINGWSGKRIATVSDRYELVQNRDIVEPLLNKFGAEAFTEARETMNGQFMYKINTGRSFEIGNDRLDEQLVAGNSYNKTKILTWMFGAFKFLCSNGMYTGMAVVNIRQRHTGNIPVADHVQQVIKSIGNNGFELWKNMSRIKLSERQMIDLVGTIPILEETDKSQQSAIEYWIENANKYWADPMPRTNPILNRQIRALAVDKIMRPKTDENPLSAWGAFNQINWAIERVMNRSEVNKKILANVNAEKSIAQAFSLN